MNARFTEGPPRAYRPVVPRMCPQQMPWFTYREVPVCEAGIKKSPITNPGAMPTYPERK